jgi:hypothetical protein
MVEKKFEPLTKNYSTFHPNNCQNALRNIAWGSKMQDTGKPIPDPGVKKAPDPQHRIFHRYHVDEPQKFGHLKPGLPSARLREALRKPVLLLFYLLSNFVLFMTKIISDYCKKIKPRYSSSISALQYRRIL